MACNGREQIKERKHQWYLANREKVAEHDRLYAEANREKRLEYARQYREANREKIRENQRLSRARAKTRNKARSQEAPNPIKPRWTPSMISRLGKEPDAVIAGSFGIGFLAVYRKRRSLGIPGWRRK